MERLLESLRKNGLRVEEDPFKEAYREAALRFLEATREDGRETHNRFWISAALRTQGHDVPPDDPRIAEGVESYFSAFSQQCRLLPGTIETLDIVKGRYRLGLLSNFTHAPACRWIIEETGLSRLFEVILISGDLGYRKPHPSVFHRLTQDLGVGKAEMLYVGDDPGPDVFGARDAGIQPVWTTYAQELRLRYVSDLVYKGLPPPDDSVPRISSWEGLLALLRLA
jgi:putative hydrolase of the HAD superfamily